MLVILPMRDRKVNYQRSGLVSAAKIMHYGRRGDRMKIRCGWVTADPLYFAYHDSEWGVPEHDDRRLFELLILEGAQAGLSWLTVLKKRENYRQAFDGFDAAKIARYPEKKLAALMNDEGIIRNRLKIASAVTNAKAFL